VPFREESCRSSCIYSGPLHSHSRDAVSQHPSTRAGAESIQLIYSGRALQALSDLARQFRCHPIFWREFTQNGCLPATFYTERMFASNRGKNTDGLAVETYSHINSAGCEGMAMTVTAAHHSISRLICQHACCKKSKRQAQVCHSYQRK